MVIAQVQECQNSAKSDISYPGVSGRPQACARRRKYFFGTKVSSEPPLVSSDGSCRRSGSAKLAGRASFVGGRAAGQLRSVDHAIPAQQQSTSASAFLLQAFDLSLKQVAFDVPAPSR